ncbi:hypothetical protein PV327_000066 [Microctonus hyperodae]|uniref:Uncharacterized protein n=1 Tax=Microctonus hyperodae TaxID=165561 RepID=A0AA39G5W4_MICHY|nr:hypothetical protein PV327_000066 [Microctonus hyperodae]
MDKQFQLCANYQRVVSPHIFHSSWLSTCIHQCQSNSSLELHSGVSQTMRRTLDCIHAWRTVAPMNFNAENIYSAHEVLKIPCK